MNNTLRVFAILLLLATALFCASCKPAEEPPPEDALMLFADGVSEFTVVRSDFADANVRDAAVLVRRILDEATGFDFPITTDWDGDNDFSARAEILIGDTNRPATAEVLATLAEDSYGIRVVGNKLVIVGTTPEATVQAVELFLKTYVGFDGKGVTEEMKTLYIRSDISDTGKLDRSPKVAMLSGNNAVYADAIRDALTAIPTRVSVFDYNDKFDDIFNTENYEAVLIVDSESVPASMMTPLGNYLKAGGKLITTGGPSFTQQQYQLDGEWYDLYSYMSRYATRLKSTKPVWDEVNDRLLNSFARSTNDTKSKQFKDIGDYDCPNDSTTSIRVECENVTSWDLITFDADMPDGNRGLAFWAKAEDAVTTGLYVELIEDDGSRWYANCMLSTEWRYFILKSSDFNFWEGATRKGTSADLANMKRLQIGFAFSGYPMSSGPHTYYIDDLRTCPETVIPGLNDVPAIDGLTPTYELYPVTNAATIEAYGAQQIVADVEYKLTDGFFSCHPGRQGTGYGKGRDSRFIPLIELRDGKDLHSGYAAWVYVFSTTGATNAYEGAMSAVFSATDPAFYDAAGVEAIADTLRMMLRDAYLIEGGAEDYIYVASDTGKIKTGITAASATEEGELVITVYDGDTKAAEQTVPLADAVVINGAHELKYYSSTLEYDTSAGGVTRVVTELRVGGETVDTLAHDVELWSPKPESERKFIYTEGNTFKRDGETLTLFGVNYMPSSGVAESNGTLFEHYVSAASYDPDVFYNDLCRVKEVGFNAVSLFVYYNSIKDSNNIMHLIEMCADLGLYVDLSLRPLVYPFSYNYEQVETLIKKCHFEENDNIVAYDIAWEYSLGKYEQGSTRQLLDNDWAKWIDLQYGSLTNAEAAWGMKAVRDGAGKVIAPTDDMLDSKNTAYTGIVAAYRRFIDDAVARQFTLSIEHMRSLDPNHLISFRMASAGSATAASSYYMYDFMSLGSTLDFVSPEGYSLFGDARQGLLANLYSRYALPDAPVVWKEFGRHIWTGSNFTNNDVMKNLQYEYYKSVLEMCDQGYTSALYCWYWPGGFRIGENSDYGVLNPDGSDRPVSLLLREYATKFKTQGDRPEYNYTITAERDDYVNFLAGMYSDFGNELIKAIDDGYFPVIINKLQTDADDIVYADEALDFAVGDAFGPATYPLRYVNGMVKSVKDGSADGKLTIKICNTQFATWRAGTVSLVSTDDSAVRLNAVIDTELGQNEDLIIEADAEGKGELKLRFEVDGVQFGYTFVTTVD